MEECQVYVARLVAKSLATKAAQVPVIPICRVESCRNVPQKKPNHEGSRISQKFRPRAVLSSPENDHLIGGDMIYYNGKTKMSQKKIGCEALVKKSVLKQNKALGLAIKKDQAPFP